MIPSKRTMVKHLRAAWDSCSVDSKAQGALWYSEAHRNCKLMADRYSLPLSSVVGVVAVLSPGRQWDLNLRDTETFLRDYSKGLRGNDLPSVGTYGRLNRLKAERLLLGESITEVTSDRSLKVRNFYQNILDPGDESAVTIDRHAKSIADNRFFSDSERWLTPKQYTLYADTYKMVAAEVGEIPSSFQASLWVNYLADEKYSAT